MVLESVDATCEPSDTLVVGALIDKAPEVSVKLIGVAADAGRAHSSEPISMAVALIRQSDRTLISPRNLRQDLDRSCTATNFTEANRSIPINEPLYQIYKSGYL
jgi:hypothetical protein